MEGTPDNSYLKRMAGGTAQFFYRFDQYTYIHSMRVAFLSVKIAERLAFTNRQMNRIWLAGFLHDFGKIYIPKSILNKPDALTMEERKLIRLHSMFGYLALRHLPVFPAVSKLVLLHHERYDGGGYPFGLKGDQTPLEVRIISIADTFDAMTSKRSYNLASTYEHAIREINHQACHMFDPSIVEHFNSVVHGYQNFKQAA